MKRYLIGTVLTAISFSMAASDSPLLDTSRPGGFGIETGLHYTIGATSVLQNYSDKIGGIAAMDVAPGVGTGMGASVEFVIREYLAIGTQFDLMLGNHRYAIAMSAPGIDRQTTLMVRNHYYWADIPIYGSLRLNLADRTKLHLDLGIYFGVGLGGHQKASIYNAYKNSIGQMIVSVSDEKWDYYGSVDDGKMALLNKVSRVDIGLHAGMGLVIREHYSVGAVLHVGCRNLAIPTPVFEPAYRTLQTLFKVGYIF